MKDVGFFLSQEQENKEQEKDQIDPSMILVDIHDVG
jgi:hypothetical protein